MNIYKEHFSLKILRSLLWMVGVWYTDSKYIQWLLNFLLSTALFFCSFAALFEITELYTFQGNLDAFTSVLCQTFPITLYLTRALTLLFRRQKLIAIIKFSENHFWLGKKTEFAEKTIREVNAKCLIISAAYGGSVVICVIGYSCVPIYSYVNAVNSTDKSFLFPGMDNIETPIIYETPYFELITVSQIFITMYLGIVTTTYNLLLCTLVTNAIGQFKLLYYNLEHMVDESKNFENHNVESFNELNRTFKANIAHHKTLFWYIEQLEIYFRVNVLLQVVLSIFIICAALYKAFLATCNFVNRVKFVSHVFMDVFEVYFLSACADDIITESTKVAEAAYNAAWYCLPEDYSGLAVRKAVLFMMVRSQKPSMLTACGFQPVSFESFVKVMSRTFSCLTLLRQVV